jgi:Tfp pilus assembly protein PilN
MAQQINLYSPILMAPKRYFSALAMVRSLAVLVLGLALLGMWSMSTTAALRRELASSGVTYNSEKKRLNAALGARPDGGKDADKDAGALTQELAQTQRLLTERQRLLDQLAPSASEASRRSELLGWMAQTVPEPVWLSDVHLVDGRLTLTGNTLQPDALRLWLDRLAQHPSLAGQKLYAAKIEHSDGPGPAGADSWSFQVTSARAEGEPR